MDDEKKELVIKILGPYESNPSENIYSYQTEVAKNILGKKVDDLIEIFQ